MYLALYVALGEDFLNKTIFDTELASKHLHKTLKDNARIQMPIIDNAPLIEAIFELRWGEIALGNFQYSDEERSLFAGKFSVAAANHGFKVIERVPGFANMPMMVSHRFRTKENVWPCFQIGLGIFTVNQTKDNYSWDLFKKSIKTGLEVFNQVDSELLNKTKDSLVMSLKYQDAFFPNQNESIEEYLKNHFNVNVSLPASFSAKASLDDKYSAVNLIINIFSNEPKGTLVITISNAIINDQPGLIMETIIQSSARDIFECSSGINSILDWSEEAHDLQKHSFINLIKPSAYEVS